MEVDQRVAEAEGLGHAHQGVVDGGVAVGVVLGHHVTGDAGDTTAPTYASFYPVSNAAGDHRDPDRTGQDVTSTLDRAGRVGTSTAGTTPGSRIAYYEKLTGHNIPEAFWTFLNASGPVQTSGVMAQQRLIDPWFYASGLPISDPYWAMATIAGKPSAVLVQAFERRVLTYVPSNPEGFRVQGWTATNGVLNTNATPGASAVSLGSKKRPSMSGTPSARK